VLVMNLRRDIYIDNKVRYVRNCTIVLSCHQQTPPLTTNAVPQLAGRLYDGVVLITYGR